jgi:ABC-type glycerol-3-phosphate transport system substrate-binding protein
MKQHIKRVVAMSLLGLSLASCGGGADNVVRDSNGNVIENKTIQVKLYKGGYGEDWLNEAITQFEKTYAEEGYKIELTDHSNAITGETVQSELLLGASKNDTDLYFVQGIPIPSVISKSQKITHDASKVVLESLDDVLDSKAIGEDKKEETDTIRSRFQKGYLDRLAYDGKLTAFQGQHFTLPWASAACSMAVNVEAFQSLNLGVDLPRTSQEFIEDITAIKAKTASSGIYPYIWAGMNASAYWFYVWETFYAQYIGRDAYMKFIDMVPESGTTKDNGYDVYKNDGLKYSLEEMQKFLSLDNSPDGSAGMKHFEAQGKLMDKKAVFMANGDWLMQEMSHDYSDVAPKIQMIKIPVLSSLGSKLGITDSQLSSVIKAVDEGKDDTAIASLVSGVSASAIAEIRSARSIFLNIGVNHNIAIPSYADAKIGAKKFVRFLYSQDGCSLYRNKAHSYLPLSYTARASDEQSDYMSSLEKVYHNSEATTISELSTFRTLAGLILFNTQSFRYPDTFADMMKDNPVTADQIYQDEYATLKTDWTTYALYA